MIKGIFFDCRICFGRMLIRIDDSVISLGLVFFLFRVFCWGVVREMGFSFIFKEFFSLWIN